MTEATTPSTHGEITLRASSDVDEPFLREVYYSTRADEMALVDWTDEQKAAFLDMQFRAQHSYYHNQMPQADYDVILEGDVAVGRLYVDRRMDEVHIVDIALLPKYRSRGIGGELMRRIMDEASADAKSVSLHVEVFNPARRFYDRLGFREERTEGIYSLLTWRSEHGPAIINNA